MQQIADNNSKIHYILILLQTESSKIQNLCEVCRLMRLILNTFYSTQNKCLSNAICSYLRDNLPKHYACLYWHVQTLVEFYENVSEYQRENLLEQEIKRIKIWNDIKISNILLMALAISMPIYHATRLHSVLRKTPILLCREWACCSWFPYMIYQILRNITLFINASSTIGSYFKDDIRQFHHGCLSKRKATM